MFTGEEKARRICNSKLITEETRWKALTEGYIKINVDAKLSLPGKRGLGVIMRNATRDIIGVAVKWREANWRPFVAEAQSFLLGLEIAKTKGWTNIEIESDCLQLIHAFYSKETHIHDVGVVISDILWLSRKFASCK